MAAIYINIRFKCATCARLPLANITTSTDFMTTTESLNDALEHIKNNPKHIIVLVDAEND